MARQLPFIEMADGQELTVGNTRHRLEFDTFDMVLHPRNVLKATRRLAAIAAILMLCVGNLAVCAGWQATPEARLACCMDDTGCPMHKAESHGSASAHAISQAQADSCCTAASDRAQSSVGGSSFVLSNGASIPAAMSVVVPAAVSALQEWRALVPLRGSPVPKHLLLSVLLI